MPICRAPPDRRTSSDILTQQAKRLCEKVENSGAHSYYCRVIGFSEVLHHIKRDLGIFAQDKTRLSVEGVVAFRNFDSISTKRGVGCAVYTNHSPITHV